MVAPLAGAMSASSIRSAGGSMLKTGKLTGGLKEITPIMSRIEKILAKDLVKVGLIYKGLKSLTDIMQKSSPAFKQQLIVLQKSLLLFLRPIGDIMAKFVRPAAVWSLRMAKKWYDVLTKQESEDLEAGGAGAEDIEDKIKQLEVEKQTKIEAGEFEAADALDRLIDELRDKQVIDKSIFDPVQDLFENLFARVFPGFNEVLSTASDALWNFIPDALLGLWASVKEAAVSFWTALKKLYEVFEPIIIGIWDLTKIIVGSLVLTGIFALIGAFKLITFVFEGVGVSIDLVKTGLIYLMEWLEHVRSFLGGAMIDAWESLLNSLKTVGNWIKDTFLTVWESLKSAFSSLWDKLKGFVDWIKGLKFWGDKEDEKATGGLISETGLYTLHAGERVLTAGETSRITSTSISITAPITIQATINNDLDIRQLAQKLSDYQETEIRKRISYI